MDLLRCEFDTDFRVVALVSFLATKLVEYVILRDAIKPRTRLIGKLRRPRLRRLEERRLRGVFAELHATNAESTREDGHQATELASEPMLRKLGRGHISLHGGSRPLPPRE